MIELEFTQKFLKQFKKLEKNVREEARQKLELFQDPSNHKFLKVHKLHGYLKNLYSFSVTSKIRIIFRYITKRHVVLLVVDDHDAYK